MNDNSEHHSELMTKIYKNSIPSMHIIFSDSQLKMVKPHFFSVDLLSLSHGISASRPALAPVDLRDAARRILRCALNVVLCPQRMGRVRMGKRRWDLMGSYRIWMGFDGILWDFLEKYGIRSFHITSQRILWDRIF